jgi:hypothetical protein
MSSSSYKFAGGFPVGQEDCVIRAITIATGQGYHEVCLALAERECVRREKLWAKIETLWSKPSDGIRYGTYNAYLREIGWEWTPIIQWISPKQISPDCQIRLHPRDLPPQRCILQLTGHVCALVDNTIHDVYNPCDADARLRVYGFWTAKYSTSSLLTSS